MRPISHVQAYFRVALLFLSVRHASGVADSTHVPWADTIHGWGMSHDRHDDISLQVHFSVERPHAMHVRCASTQAVWRAPATLGLER